jgi:prolyl oligopeptidase
MIMENKKMGRTGRVLAAIIALSPVTRSSAQPIATPVVPVVDVIQGVTVRDPYRWLEDSADPKVQAWSQAQNAHTHLYLDALSSRAGIRTKLAALVDSAKPSFSHFLARGPSIFCLLKDPVKEQRILVALDAAGDPESRKVVLDPNLADAAGSATIDWFTPSPDGSLVALSLSRNGSENGTLHLYDMASGKEIGEPIPDVQHATASGSLAWAADGTGFWYTRYPGEERPEPDRTFWEQVYFHKLGGDWRQDRLALGTQDGLPRIAEIVLGNDSFRDFATALISNGDGGEFSIYVLKADGAAQIAAFDDKIVYAASGPDDALYAISREGAPLGKILKMKPPFTRESLARAQVLVPESELPIQSEQDMAGLRVTGSQVFVRYLAGGPNEIRIFGLDGVPQGKLPLPELAALDEIAPLTDGGVLYSVFTYLRPRYVAHWNAATGKSEETKLGEAVGYDFDDMEAVRETATSKDGTQVPIYVIRKKGLALDGSHPTLVYGYGGYGVSESPYPLGARIRLWLDGGGVYADVVVRGGGEFGESWHRDGYLTKKQNAFDDFAAAAQHLVDRHYTSPDKLAIFGESNGGLLVGATLVQHPGLMRAVVSRVGIYDMLRAELDPNGAFNITEFGTVKDKDQFKALYAYSPYHHLVAGMRYPAALLTTGDNDNRVDPMQSRKFTAALQAATSSGLPVLLRTNAFGHGMGSSKSATEEEDADIVAFLYDQLGMTWHGDTHQP